MRLRFSIRDLLWLTLVAALAVGWWVDHKRLSSPSNFPILRTIPFGSPFRPTDSPILPDVRPALVIEETSEPLIGVNEHTIR
jgi:hypothetical protein